MMIHFFDSSNNRRRLERPLWPLQIRLDLCADFYGAESSPGGRLARVWRVSTERILKEPTVKSVEN